MPAQPAEQDSLLQPTLQLPDIAACGGPATVFLLLHELWTIFKAIKRSKLFQAGYCVVQTEAYPSPKCNQVKQHLLYCIYNIKIFAFVLSIGNNDPFSEQLLFCAGNANLKPEGEQLQQESALPGKLSFHGKEGDSLCKKHVCS